MFGVFSVYFQAGAAAVARVALEAGCDANLADDAGDTPLHLAGFRSPTLEFRWFRLGRIPTCDLALARSMAFAKTLIGANSDSIRRSPYPRSRVFENRDHLHAQVVSEIYISSPDIYIYLHISNQAAASGSGAVVKLLLDSGANARYPPRTKDRSLKVPAKSALSRDDTSNYFSKREKMSS